jgi:formylglycine-generating enzyme required for sulfatase activity
MQLWQPNQLIQNGKHLIQKIVGSGGFGITYQAQDTKSGKWVAIKTLNHMEQSKPDFRQRQQKFVNEALRLARCSHPYVVSIYELIEEDGLWGMVMEYVEGEDLATYLDNRGVFTETEALDIIGKIGEALEFIHKNGFLHRDIKPNNIILRQESKLPVLIDFGLAREFTLGKVQSMTNHRTEHFAPIEQYERQGEPGAYTDIYALAATLYVLLTGQLPFPANFRQSGMSLIEPKQHNPKISDRVNQAIIKGMELVPKDRPQSVKEWLDLLKTSGLPKFRFEVVTVNDKGQITQRQQHEAEYFTEDLGNGITLDMVSIPGGTFMMGSPSGEGDDDEKPQHRVTISPFFMGKFTITQAQWQAVASLPKIARDLKLDPSYFKGKNRPVESVSWSDAMEFCARLSRHTGKIYRLPSETGWEYACRAGTTTPFYFGETISTDLANYRGTDWEYEGKVYPGNYGKGLKGIYREQTTGVGSFPANGFGLYDMHGNVWELCADSWHKNYAGAPSNGSSWIDNDNQSCVLRGGSWDYDPYSCRSAFRNYSTRGLFLNRIGFRVVCLSGRTV